MTLRQATRAIALLTGITCVGILYVTSDLLPNGEYAMLEEEAVRHRIDRFVHAYERELDQFDRLTSTWGSTETASVASFDRNLRPGLSVTVDGEGKIVTTRWSGDLTPEIQPIQLTSQLTEAGLIGKAFKGVFSFSEGPLVIASRPIGDEGGHTVLLASHLQADRENADSRLQILYGEAAEWPSEFFSATPTTGTVILPGDANFITGYRAIHDITGQPAALLKVDLPRTLNGTMQSRNLLLILFGSFVLASGALLVGAMRRSVLSPIEGLCERLSEIARNGRRDERVEIAGSEEVSRLGEQVNALLGRIRQSESDLIRTERMRVAGELSAGVSHNLNNILTGILGPSEYLEQTLEDPDQLVEARRIHRAALKARDLVARFGQAVRHGAPTRARAVDVNQAVRLAIETVRPRWQDEAQGRGIQIEIERDLNAALPIQGTPDELHDILVNLLMNAVDALEENGTIRVQTADVEGHVNVFVSDDGTGMDASTRERIYEPFFTTKAAVGAGLGLATVFGTLRRWGGDISVESQPGSGSTFTLVLARSWGSVVVLDQEQPALPSRSGRILIAEDDQIVREVLAASLSDRHELIIAEDGQQAMDLIESDRFDVALIDLSLPHVPGDQIARRLRRVDPTVVTVLMTGWDLTEDDPRRVPFDDHVPKPISSRDDVRDVVARCLQVNDSRKLRV
jgi:signal transduction histidine kinase